MSYKTMKQSQDWKKNYNWTDKDDHPVEDIDWKIFHKMFTTGKRDSEVLNDN